MTDGRSSLARTIAERAAALAFADVPAEVVARAKLHILDAMGVALAASDGDFAGTMLRSARRLGGAGPHVVIGRGERLSLRDAVQVNAALVHCLDFDDTHGPSVVHVSATALPVALALAAEHKASGRELLLAYLLSVETAALVGAAAGGAFHERGFHPTGTVNLFGAAVAAGRLVGLDEAGLAAAQGIALSFASGSFEFLDSGAWSKRAHPGWAGAGGVTAAALAAEGFVAPPLPYEGRFGLYRLYTPPGTNPDLSLADRFCRDWQMLAVGIKPLPACHYTHAFSDAALEIVEAGKPDPAAIEDILVRVPKGIVDIVCEPEAAKRLPRSSYEAQFSIQYVVAATLLRARFTLDEIEPQTIADPDILSLAAKVRYEIDPDADFPRYYPGEVIVRMRDGRELTARRSAHRGSDASPLSAEDIRSKFRANAGRVAGPGAVDRIIAAVDALDRADDVESLIASLADFDQRSNRTGREMA